MSLRGHAFSIPIFLFFCVPNGTQRAPLESNSMVQGLVQICKWKHGIFSRVHNFQTNDRCSQARFFQCAKCTSWVRIPMAAGSPAESNNPASAYGGGSGDANCCLYGAKSLAMHAPTNPCIYKAGMINDALIH